MGVDGIDNGVEQYPVDVKSNYSDKTTLGSRVNRLFPVWTEKNTDENLCFMNAIEIAD
jgi:urease accessory protein